MERRLGVYIHIPFCASKCEYCDFYSLAGCDQLIPKYHNALLTHISEASAQLSGYYIDSVYFGGGTPSYYGARRVCEIFNTLKKSGRVLKSAEVTIEVNPESVSKRDFIHLRKEGVNRVSLGVQSADSDILRLIGRRHTFKQASAAMKNARRAGIDNISADLIYGLPSQTKNEWAQTMSRLLSLQPEHISCYGLKLEEGTPMYANKDSPFLPSDDEQADMYLYAVETLERYGYVQYEISNFCLPGYESRHNLKYWNLEDYMAFGSSAHSCVNGIRYSYVKDIHQYISGVLGEGSILDEYEEVGSLDRASEYIMLGMRTSKGISAKEYYQIYRNDFTYIEELLADFEKHGWTRRVADRWTFTSSGFLLSNVLIGALLEVQAGQKLSSTPWVQDTFLPKETGFNPSDGTKIFA